jgi:hypothetical protein
MPKDPGYNILIVQDLGIERSDDLFPFSAIIPKKAVANCLIDMWAIGSGLCYPQKFHVGLTNGESS